MYQKMDVTAVTSKGSREENQDNFRIDTMVPYVMEESKCVHGTMEADDKIHIVCVCDGIGGGSLGKAATISTLDIISSFLEKQDPEEKLEEVVEKIVNKMAENISRIFEKIGQEGGTTLALLAWKEDQFYAVNIGDSPIYRIRDHHMEKLSEEHTLAEYKLRKGLTPSEGEENVLINYIGRKEVSGKEMMHGITGELQEGDSFFLCSDGITKVFDGKQIQEMILNGEADQVEKMVKQAGEDENSDNSTALLLKVR